MGELADEGLSSRVCIFELVNRGILRENKLGACERSLLQNLYQGRIKIHPFAGRLAKS